MGVGHFFPAFRSPHILAGSSPASHLLAISSKQSPTTASLHSPLRSLYHPHQAVQTKAKRAINSHGPGAVESEAAAVQGSRLTLPWATLEMTKPHSPSSWAASSLSCVSSSSASCDVPPPWSPKRSSKKQRSSRRRAKNGAAVTPRRTSSIYRGVTRCVIGQGFNLPLRPRCGWVLRL